MDARALLVAAGVALAAWLQGPAGENNAERRRNDFRYTPDPRLVRVVAGAQRSSVADALWLRALPDMSREFADPALKARWIDGVIGVVTDLEPQFWTVYDFGQSYLTHLDRRATGSADRAIALLEKGIRANPDAAGLYVRLAMVHWKEKKDRAKTVELLRRASQLPGIDDLSLRMLASLEAEGREDLFAIRPWAEIMESPNAELRRVGELNLERVKRQIATRAVREFREKEGRLPAHLDELRGRDLIEPTAIEVVLQGLVLSPEGRITSARLDELEYGEIVQGAERWARSFRDETGRWPGLEDAVGRGLNLPPPPRGRQWRYEGGKLWMVDATPDAPQPPR